MLLFDFADLVCNSLLVSSQSWNTRLLVPVLDLNAHFCGRTLHDVVRESLLLLLTYHGVRLGLRSRTCQEAHVELLVSIDHHHLFSELGDVEALGRLGGRRRLHREY